MFQEYFLRNRPCRHCFDRQFGSIRRFADEIMKGTHPAPVHDHLSTCVVRFSSQAIFIKGPDGIFHRIAELIGS